MAPFEFDQEYAANFAYSVIKEFPIQLIGQGLSVQGLFMGPLYFYYLVPFYFIFSLHPLGGILGSIILGMITVLVYFVIGKKFFGEKAGLILAFWRATFMSKIQVDWDVIPSMSSELLVIVTWYLFYLYWQGKTKYLPLLGLVFGLYTSFHPILFPFYFVFVILFLIKRNVPKLKTFLLSLVGFIIPLAPLIIFEYLHSFWEVKNLFSVIGKGEPVTFSRFLYHLYVNIREPNLVFGLHLKAYWLLFALVGISILILIYKKIDFWKENFHKTMLAITFVVFIVYYSLFPTHVPEYYFLGISVLFFFYTGGLLGILAKKKSLKGVVWLILAYLAIVNFCLLKKGWDYPFSSSYYHKEKIVKEIIKRKPQDSEFYVSYIKEPGWNFGFDYLFKLYGEVPQTKEAKKPIYTIVIPKSLSPGNLDFVSGNIGLIVEE
jgi:4-amino-4-deoxy-L-arabinose transferase-like glycosyltransferase